ncbi:hypothetical protein RhiJN_05940 [Ceratobasidium sp. AG-Ba]|nr:hypothetical protein RhiJN_05940 [Ceratobasidium sp. AG-Ba]QRW06864.1 hypothetical protein RhiLY_05863 [Ceratobasidium sp. AG-Ba]
MQINKRKRAAAFLQTNVGLLQEFGAWIEYLPEYYEHWGKLRLGEGRDFIRFAHARNPFLAQGNHENLFVKDRNLYNGRPANMFNKIGYGTLDCILAIELPPNHDSGVDCPQLHILDQITKVNDAHGDALTELISYIGFSRTFMLDVTSIKCAVSQVKNQAKRGKNDFDLYAKRQPGSSLTRLKLSHRRALSQDSPGTADGNKRSLQGIPEFSGTGLKASETFSFTVQPPSTSTAPPVPPSTSRTSSRRTSLPASPKPEHVEDTFGPLRCPSPEHVEVSEDARKQIEEVLQSGKQDERLLDPESSIVIVPSPADIPLPADEKVVPQVEAAPVAPVVPLVPVIPVVPVTPAVPVTSEPISPPVCASPSPQAKPVFNAPARAPLPCDVSSDVEKGLEPAVEERSLAQDPIVSIAIAAVGAVGAVGAVLRAGSGVPRKDTVPTPPVVPLEPPALENEKPKPYASSKVKQPNIMDLIELPAFRGQL